MVHHFTHVTSNGKVFITNASKSDTWKSISGIDKFLFNGVKGKPTFHQNWVEYAKKENPNNLITALQNAGFEITDELLGQLYVEINSCDWIHGSCGGCI